jgi:hypothetical protein
LSNPLLEFRRDSRSLIDWLIDRRASCKIFHTAKSAISGPGANNNEIVR